MADRANPLEHVHRAACAENGCALLPPSPAPVGIQRGGSVSVRARVLGLGAGLAAVHLAYNPHTVGVVSALDAQYAAAGTVLLITGALTTAAALLPVGRRKSGR